MIGEYLEVQQCQQQTSQQNSGFLRFLPFPSFPFLSLSSLFEVFTLPFPFPFLSFPLFFILKHFQGVVGSQISYNITELQESLIEILEVCAIDMEAASEAQVRSYSQLEFTIVSLWMKSCFFFLMMLPSLFFFFFFFFSLISFFQIAMQIPLNFIAIKVISNGLYPGDGSKMEKVLLFRLFFLFCFLCV